MQPWLADRRHPAEATTACAKDAQLRRADERTSGRSTTITPNNLLAAVGIVCPSLLHLTSIRLRARARTEV